VDEQLASPIEEVGFGRIHVGGGFVFVGGGDELAIFFLDLAEKIVEFGGIFLVEEIVDELARIGELIGHDKGKGEVVAVVVGRRFYFLGALKEGNGLRDFSDADIGFAQVVIGVEAIRSEFRSFLKLGQSEIWFADAHEAGGEIGASCGVGGLEANGRLQVGIAFVVLGLSGVGEAEEFVEFEAFGSLAEEGFQLGGGFGIVAGFVLGGGGLKFLVEGFGLWAGTGARRHGHSGQESERC